MMAEMDNKCVILIENDHLKSYNKSNAYPILLTFKEKLRIKSIEANNF